jgi:aryl-alcohol dehydrogenase-like predicted oxidoreductase
MTPARPLGTTGYEITPTGLGAWAMGGGGWAFGWGPQDDGSSLSAILRAVELGVNWVDTAAVYGFGRSEEVVGAALRRLPADERPLVFTKCGVVRNPDGPMHRGRRVGDPASLREGLESSLRRLGVEAIDLFQMHQVPEDGTPVEEYWGTLLEFAREGHVRQVGLSNHPVELLERAEAIGHVASVQPPLSLVVRDAAGDVIPWCAAHGTGVIVYSPMQAGLLTGSFSPERVAALPEDDWRKRNPQFQGEALAANLALVEALRPIAQRHGTSLAAVAIAWALSVPGVSGAIVGARDASQVDGWISAAELDLDEDDLTAVRRSLEVTGAGSGPVAG